MITPNGKTFRSLRRYASLSDDDKNKCALSGLSYHNAESPISDGVVNSDGYINGDGTKEERLRYEGHWPTFCVCGYQFLDSDPKQIFSERQYQDEQGKIYTLRNAPPGAMYNATWLNDMPRYTGPDGLSLVVIVPGKYPYPWTIDGVAKNCDSPCSVCGVPYHAHSINDSSGHYYSDSKPGHKCWVRHGVPPNIHVDKNGFTCGAGAGSIAVDGYHGFLHNGELTDG
jgi:hypothetical protein